MNSIIHIRLYIVFILIYFYLSISIIFFVIFKYNFISFYKSNSPTAFYLALYFFLWQKNLECIIIRA